MTVFFSSDTHFGHKLMVNKNRYTSPYREYNDVDEMDVDIVERMNKQAKSGDTIYILGDFSFRKPAETRDILSFIAADVVLVKGNHDHRKKNSFISTVEYADMLKEFHMYLERKFTLNPEGPEQLICMQHFPLMHWHKQHYGSWHLHGHLHGKLLSLQDVADYMATKPVRGNHHEEEIN